jgi:hypothetical protein
VTRKTDEIDAMEKQIAESLVDQVRDDLLRAAGKEPEPDSNPDGEFNWDDLACVAAEMRQASAEPECDAQSRAELTSYIARLEFALKIKRTRKGAWRRTPSRPHSANAPALEALKPTKNRPRRMPPLPQ